MWNDKKKKLMEKKSKEYNIGMQYGKEEEVKLSPYVDDMVLYRGESNDSIKWLMEYIEKLSTLLTY